MKNKLKVFSIVLILLSGVLILTGCENKSKDDNNMQENTKNVTLKLNAEGQGQVSYYVNNTNKMEFDDEYPIQSATTNIKENTKVTIDAKAAKDWKFVKWTKDGKEFSTKPKLEITVSEDSEYIAVFELK